MRLYPTLLTIGLLSLAGGFILREQVAETRTETFADTTPQTGDIIFQKTRGSQAIAVEQATHSPWSHCGMVIRDSTGIYVIEGVEPVSITTLEEFTAGGIDGKYTIKRLKKDKYILTDSTKKALVAAARQNLGKHYDLYFGWSDDRIYCSELVWKSYQNATGLEVGKTQKLKEFDLTSAVVKAKLKERYGNNIPYDEKVISVDAIYKSDLLETIIVDGKSVVSKKAD